MHLNSLTEKLESQLDSFSTGRRTQALNELIEQVRVGEINLPPTGTEVNLHCHTFYSYNACGYSPTGFAWRARKAGLAVAGIVDFDVLDGLDEFLQASVMLGLKACVGLETRVFVPEFADSEINSPGEPGIAYHMGVGFTTGDLETLPGGKHLSGFSQRLRAIARDRNTELMKRVNDYLTPVRLDYEQDVIPLTPSGNATERHLCLAYARKARQLFHDDRKLSDFWAEKLHTPAQQILALLPEDQALLNLVRSKTMKRPGPGYVTPDTGAFPRLEETNRFILAAGAVPTLTWLNGLSEGEQHIEQLLEVAMATGTAAVNIVPDRNFTPGVKDRKLENLYAFVELARKLDLPIIAGTEMNSPGQKFVDDFKTEELGPLLGDFLKGGHILYAHTALQKYAGLGYTSAWAQENLSARAQRNDFYRQIGESLPAGAQHRLTEFDQDTAPRAILDAVKKWNQS